MTPKEKAQELYHKYFSMIKIESPIDRVSSIPYVKKCALIVVDEILNGYEFDSLDIEHKRIIDNINYWDKVKQEIENL
jgi:hypothetical protein